MTAQNTCTCVGAPQHALPYRLPRPPRPALLAPLPPRHTRPTLHAVQAPHACRQDPQTFSHTDSSKGRTFPCWACRKLHTRAKQLWGGGHSPTRGRERAQDPRGLHSASGSLDSPAGPAVAPWGAAQLGGARVRGGGSSTSRCAKRQDTLVSLCTPPNEQASRSWALWPGLHQPPRQGLWERPRSGHRRADGGFSGAMIRPAFKAGTPVQLWP